MPADPRPPVVAVVGGGQLARMMQPAAIPLGVHLRVLAEDALSSAAQVVPDVVLGSPAAGEGDRAAGGPHDAAVTGSSRATALPGVAGPLARLVQGAAVLTLEHEQVPTDALRALVAAGVAVRPGPDALEHAQDKLLLRARLDDLGVPGPRWAAVADAAELAAFGDRVGWPVVVKTPRGGYDGKGVRVVEAADQAQEWLDRAAGDGAGGLLAEERVDFARELAVLVARSPSGQAAAWPVVESVQVDGVCREVVAPAPDLDPEVAAAASATALRIAGELGVVGVMAMEAFETRDGRVLVNELAMRPHNSGHWTIEGATTSQFEQHLRAVLDLPLGDVRARARWTVMVNVLGSATPEVEGHSDLFRAHLHVMAHDPAVKVHLYGKAVRPGRKVGHVTAWGDDLDDARARARHAADFISGTIDG